MNPVWFNPGHHSIRHCRGDLRRALTCTGSLTEYLSQYCACDLSLDISSEAWQRCVSGDTLTGIMDADQHQYIREIYLSCGDQPLIYGRSLFPRRTWMTCKSRLSQLGDRPLGEWLFNDRRIYRLFTQVGRIGRHSRLYRIAMAGLKERPAFLWGRRSVFIINGYPLLVIEIFLPPLIKCIKSSKKAAPF